MSQAPDTSNILELPSDLINEDMDSFKQSLLVALAAQRPTALSGKYVTRVGTAALQLLVAFRKECVAREIRFELREASRPLLETVACAGLEGELGLSPAA